MYPRKNTPSGNLTAKLAVVFMIVSTGYLGYALIHYEHWGEIALSLRSLSAQHLWWGVAVVLLLPVNWLTEAFKWQRVSRSLERLTLLTSLRAVLAGAATGFVTPNRLGDIVGRLHYLAPQHHRAGLSLAAVNSLTQHLAILLTGIPFALLMMQHYSLPGMQEAGHYLGYFLSVFVVLLFAMYLLVRMAKSKKEGFVVRVLTALRPYAIRDLAMITAFSVLRFIVFNFQLYAMLQLLGVGISPWQALLSIPTTYLFVSFTPSIAVSEMIVRSTYAVLFIGFFSGDVAQIALAGSALWLVNVVVPVVAGNLMLLAARHRS